jgi:hypothetical protein
MIGNVDYSTWLTKQQAAERIGCSTKTVEKLAQDRRIQQAAWRRPTGGPAVAVYHPDDVARIAQERRPEASAFVLPAGPVAPNGNGARGELERASPIAPGDDVLRSIFAAALRAVTSEKSQNLSEKLFLTLEEAATFSGLSQTCLRRLIAGGKLDAMRDRGLRIRRRDLEAL